MTDDWLVCGSRKKIKGYKELVFEKLDDQLGRGVEFWKPDSIIEGCCPDSADACAEEWAKEKGIRIQHHPATSGNYLNRNIEMVKKASLVIAFFDGYSYGTAHTIAQAVMRKVPVIIYDIKTINKHICGCGDSTSNSDGICDTCKLLEK